MFRIENTSLFAAGSDNHTDALATDTTLNAY
jgi:hypothetical protein